MTDLTVPLAVSRSTALVQPGSSSVLAEPTSGNRTVSSVVSDLVWDSLGTENSSVA
ncbi:Uncharacterised protein [Mycobacteroides abscessus subsp. abscessus]|nr:Uncharacterised protein [Mycobacteroides abscessus subsp. abscessus]SKU94756.1 Uncharacterised protein [Mycobacteroides abscessus subsp. abscessus]